MTKIKELNIHVTINVTFVDILSQINFNLEDRFRQNIDGSFHDLYVCAHCLFSDPSYLGRISEFEASVFCDRSQNLKSV